MNVDSSRGVQESDEARPLEISERLDSSGKTVHLLTFCAVVCEESRVGASKSPGTASKNTIDVQWVQCDTFDVSEGDFMLLQEEGGGVENFPLLHRGRHFLVSAV